MTRFDKGIFLKTFLRSGSGATAIEYALIAGGISILIVASVALIGTSVSGTFTSVANGF